MFYGRIYDIPLVWRTIFTPYLMALNTVRILAQVSTQSKNWRFIWRNMNTTVIRIICEVKRLRVATAFGVWCFFFVISMNFGQSITICIQCAQEQSPVLQFFFSSNCPYNMSTFSVSRWPTLLKTKKYCLFPQNNEPNVFIGNLRVRTSRNSADYFKWSQWAQSRSEWLTIKPLY